MSHYTHLTITEREDIMILHKAGHSIGYIASVLNRSKSTISRELKRNSFNTGRGRTYRASTAQKHYEHRRENSVRKKLLDQSELRDLVICLIELHWSPEQIQGRLKLEHGKHIISTATIYRAIDQRILITPDTKNTKRGLKSKLRHKGKRRHRQGEEERRGKIPNTRSIVERPAEVEERKRLGDWEGDTVVGRGAGACLVTLVDRMSKYLEGGRANAHTKDAVRDVEIKVLSKQEHVNTVTLDRGKEFAAFAEVEEVIDVMFYFALPHHPWQRGTNENTNGLLREYFPKGTDFANVSDEEIALVYDAINNRPRKSLGYRTPFEVHYSKDTQLIDKCCA